MYNLNLLPMKLRVLQVLGESEKTMTVEDVMKKLEPEYGNESQFFGDRIETYITAMMNNGMVTEDEAYFDENGKIVVKYKVTPLGEERMKYLPNNHNEAAYT